MANGETESQAETQADDLLSQWDELEQPSCILVVDDHDHIRRVIRLHLEKAGFTVAEASGGKEALKIIQDRPVQLVVLDIMMPELDGFAVCEHIRKSSSQKDAPVLMLTALNRKNDVIRALQVGANGYLLKPFRRKDLLRKVQELLGKEAGAARSGQGDQRSSPRNQVNMNLTWSPDGTEAAACKTRVVNLSRLGLLFEAERCKPCPGYEKGGVHAKCRLARHAASKEGATLLPLTLHCPDGASLRLQARIVHIYQPAETPDSEQIGVKFHELDQAQLEVLDKLVSSASESG